jgi:DNA polymerase (family 10)
MVNQEISRLFETIADALEFQGANRFRVGAYRRGAREVADLPEDVTVLVAEGRLLDVPGIGKGLAADIEEYLETHRMTTYEEATEGVPVSLLELKGVSGLGPRRLAQLHAELGVRDLAGLERALEDGSIASLSGFGPRLVESLQQGVAAHARTRERMTVAEALALSERILEQFGQVVDVSKAVFAGSLRRFRESCGDLDLLLPARKGSAVVSAFIKLPGVERVLAAGDTKASILVEGMRQVDLRVVPPSSMGAALCYFTGSKEHNVRLREIARKKGLRLNEYGVFRNQTRQAGKTEEEVYAALDLAWIPPEMREDRGEIEASREGRLPDVLRSRQVRGDLHVHSRGGGGSTGIADLARAARERGLAYLAVTDHGEGAPSHGRSPSAWRKQAREIAALQGKKNGLRLLHGIEVEIGPGGEIEFPAEILAEADWVVAGIHVGLGENVTARLLGAMENPHVDAIAHPTGRLLGRREVPAGLDLDAILGRAAETRTALEINANRDRLDLPAETARRAGDMGVPLVLVSDAHEAAGLADMELGVRLARRAWLTRKQILNTGPPSRLRKATRIRQEEKA